jgi:mono/diheme cytochrome c family protein
MIRALAFALLMICALPAEAEMSVASLYTLHCSGCHGTDGSGTPENGIPNLKDAGHYVGIKIGREYLIQVPGLSQSTLDDRTAALLLNYVLHRFSADALPADFQPYTTEEVAQFRGDRASDAPRRRREILAELKAKGLPLPSYSTP